MKRIAAIVSMSMALVVALPSVAWAHVVVTPAEASTASRTTFNVSVPNEKEIAVTGLRVVVPAGMESVTPTVKPGWTISTTKDDKKNVTEIKWEGGSIPTEQRDDFTFRALVPAKEGELIWKAYQTYADGTIASWDQKPAEEGSGHNGEKSDKGPYSVTKIIDEDVAAAVNQTTTQAANDKAMLANTSTWALTLSLVALGLSLLALVKIKLNKPKSAAPTSSDSNTNQG